MSHSEKFLPPGGTFVVCCLLLSGAMASAQNSKTTVKYPTGHAVSRSLRDLPIDVLGRGDLEAPEPKPLPLRSHGSLAAAKADPVQQQDIRPFVAATKGINFDGTGALGSAPSDVNLAV